MFTVAAYVTDTTSDPSKLSVRMARLEAMAFLGGTIAKTTSGLWIKYLGFAAPYWFIFACQFCLLLYIILSLPESHEQLPYGNNSCFSCRDIKALAGVIVKKRYNNGRLRILLLLLVSALTVLPAGVLVQLVILFAKDFPLCWRADLIGYFLGCIFFGRAVGVVTFMKILKLRRWKDYSIVQLGSVFLIALLVMIGVSSTTTMMFIGWHTLLK